LVSVFSFLPLNPLWTLIQSFPAPWQDSHDMPATGSSLSFFVCTVKWQFRHKLDLMRRTPIFSAISLAAVLRGISRKVVK
jgi:hypothetical protein